MSVAVRRLGIVSTCADVNVPAQQPFGVLAGVDNTMT